MPRGLSWQQQTILTALAGRNGPVPLAWFSHYGTHALSYDHMDDRALAERRIDLTVRRSIARLEKRGLVETGWRRFTTERGINEGPYYLRDDHGRHTRSLIAVSLTGAGRDAAHALARKTPEGRGITPEGRGMTPEERNVITMLERIEGRALTEQEIRLSLAQAVAIGEIDGCAAAHDELAPRRPR